jgi:hypothetical protein
MPSRATHLIGCHDAAAAVSDSEALGGHAV